MDYPGRVIKQGESDVRIVRALKGALNAKLVLSGADAVPLDPDNPLFGPAMKSAVRLFQARNVDGTGLPLLIDGAVGSLTWAALFGDATVPVSIAATDPLLAAALGRAQGEEAKGVREKPLESNNGPEVRAYLASVGLGPGFAWCCAFTYWCFDEAAKALGRRNPMVRTAGVLDHWNRSARIGARRITKAEAVADPFRVTPGMLFIMDFGHNKGHTGFVERVDGGLITTVEGNTDASLSREGGGVYRQVRKLASIEKGFIDYSGL